MKGILLSSVVFGTLFLGACSVSEINLENQVQTSKSSNGHDSGQIPQTEHKQVTCIKAPCEPIPVPVKDNETKDDVRAL